MKYYLNLSSLQFSQDSTFPEKENIRKKEQDYYKISLFLLLLISSSSSSSSTVDRTTPVLEYSFPRVDEGEKAGRKKKGRKESKVNANRPRYPNDGIYTGRLHGDDLQPNRLICLRYSIFFYVHDALFIDVAPYPFEREEKIIILPLSLSPWNSYSNDRSARMRLAD